MRFRPYAFNNPCLRMKGYPLPELLYKHQYGQPAGEIASLTYDDKGNLRVVAHVVHELAKRCNAFSVGARINAYEIRDADSKNAHALVIRQRLPKTRIPNPGVRTHSLRIVSM